MRIAFRIILVLVFGLIFTVIVLGLLAEMRFNLAEKCDKEYRWQEALGNYQQAIKLNPFNSAYPAGLAGFLRRMGAASQDKPSYLKKSELLYKRAIKLNPENTYYYLGLGRVYLGQKALERAISNFRKVVARDPNGFDANYMAGHSLLKMWKSLDDGVKEWVTERLILAAQLRPWGAEKNIYPALYYYTRDSLLAQKIAYAAMKPRIEKLKSRRAEELTDLKAGSPLCLEAISAKDWKGKSFNQKNTYKDGNMYWDGTMYSRINILRAGRVIRIQAKGAPASGIFPYMFVNLDDRVIGEGFVDSSEWKDFDFNLGRNSQGCRILSVTFVNDAGNKIRKEDRNLFIGNVMVMQDE